MGRVHVLVNCAGVAFEVPVLDIGGAQWDEVIAVNLTAPFVLSQELARHMVASGGGCIVNVSSVDAFIAESPYADYNASKAGLSMLTRSMAFELGHLGVRVNAVAPGATVTPMLEGGFEERVYRRYMDITPAKRYATPEEQANVVLFLASDEASYVNGVTVRVDGGMLQGFWADPRLDLAAAAGGEAFALGAPSAATRASSRRGSPGESGTSAMRIGSSPVVTAGAGRPGRPARTSRLRRPRLNTPVSSSRRRVARPCGAPHPRDARCGARLRRARLNPRLTRARSRPLLLHLRARSAERTIRCL